jgi:hypothetical protein
MQFYDASKSPLPTLLPPLDSIDDDSVSRALTMLENLQKSIPTMPDALNQSYPVTSKAAALLYALMDYAPLASARGIIAKDIVDCVGADDEVHVKLLQLATDYASHLILPCAYAISLFTSLMN